MSSTPNLAQVHYRIRTDTGAVDATPTWAAAEDVAASVAVETTFRIRFVIQNTGTAFSTAPFALRVSKNGGAYTAVTTTSGATVGGQAANASSDADDTALNTARLTAGTGTYTTFLYDETGAIGTGATLPNGQYCEIEWGLILKTAGAVAGDTFDFRIYHATSTAFTTYTQTARVSVPPSSGTDFQQKSAQVGTYSHYDAAGHTTSVMSVTAAQAIGDLVVLQYATDNNSSGTAADENALSTVTDSAGNVWTKAAEWMVTGSGSQAGAVAGIWYSQLIAALSTSATITMTWSNSTVRDAVAATACSFTVAANKAVYVRASATGTALATTAVPALNPTTPSIECLRYRVHGNESLTLTTFGTSQHTSGWTGAGDAVASSGTAATSIGVGGEWLISTGTGGNSAPAALSVAADQCGVYVAFTARDLANGSEFDEKNHLFSTASDYNSAGHATTAVTVVASGGGAIGDLMVLAYATDNSTGSIVSGIAGITDSKSNTWQSGHYANFNVSGSLSGVNAGIWWSQLTTALVGGDTVTATWSATQSDRDAVAISLNAFAIAAGRTVAVEATNAATGNAGTPPSLDATTANIECLRYRVTGFESFASQPLFSTGWAPVAVVTANSGTSLTSQSLSGEFKISTGTSDASTPIAGATVDMASVYVAFKTTAAGPDTEDDLLANDVKSNSTVTNPAIQQVHNPLANDVKSNSSVSVPAMVQRRDLLANDVISASSVSQPALVVVAGPTALLANDVLSASTVGQPAATILRGLLANDVQSNSAVGNPALKALHGLLANDVKSNSSVTQPAVKTLHGLLANDVKSNSSVSQPAAVIGRTLLANDVLSASSVSQPAAGIQRALLANDVVSASFVSNPILGIVGIVQGRDVTSTSSVSTPALKSLQGLLANDVKSPSSVTSPAALVLRVLLANDVVSQSSVSRPVVGEVGAIPANDVVSASFVSTPQLVVIGGEVLPPVLGGAARPYGRYLTRKRWEELLRQLEHERRQAQERADAFRGKKDRAKARKAAREASAAIAQAIEAAEAAQAIAHADSITRMLEGASRAASLAAYLEQMQAVRLAAIEWEDEDDVETVLMMVA